MSVSYVVVWLVMHYLEIYIYIQVLWAANRGCGGACCLCWYVSWRSLLLSALNMPAPCPRVLHTHAKKAAFIAGARRYLLLLTPAVHAVNERPLSAGLTVSYSSLAITSPLVL